jgi:glycerol-1-phosphate dehydrogenase [NAD(P)+]
MAKLHNLDWKQIAKTLKEIGAPTTAQEININERDAVKALLLAQSLRPERYTILKKVSLDEQSALRLLKDTAIL